MNNLQPEKHQDDQPFEDKLLATAWTQVEDTFRTSGMVAPLPGFTSRWMARLELERQREERRQAWALILTNLVIALGFLILIGMGFLPSISANGGVVNLWVGLLSRLVVFFKLAGGLTNTMIRTLPGVVPASWWVGGLTLVGIVVVLWLSMVRRHMRDQGAVHEES
ncbi:MAG: hypothetical protein PVI99_05295 [Anaerolineales bacterium]|jgi:hypothetical protein